MKLTKGTIQDSVCNGVDYLLDQQIVDGHWEEYDLPVGRSDQWVTAYVALVLTELGPCRRQERALAAAADGAKWLRRRTYPIGWGFNARTGPDADSTAHVLLLFKALKSPEHPVDVGWLLERWQPSYGFSTYAGPGGWGTGHPDVTPPVYRALPHMYQVEFRRTLIRYLAQTRRLNGTWPSYWWRTCHYSTYLNLSMMQTCHMGRSSSPVMVSTQEQYAIHSAFDLAYVVGIAFLQRCTSALIQDLVAELLLQQESDGRWPGSKNLRITEPECLEPWHSPSGKLYVDTKSLITTASAVRVLSKMISD